MNQRLRKRVINCSKMMKNGIKKCRAIASYLLLYFHSAFTNNFNSFFETNLFGGKIFVFAKVKTFLKLLLTNGNDIAMKRQEKFVARDILRLLNAGFCRIA